jgi:hypothetical protein
VRKSLTTEYVLYILAFSLALAVRLIWLGSPPLDDTEAPVALQALALSRGDPAAVGTQPAYVLLSGVLFFFFGGTNFLARFLPALGGSLLVLTPLALRPWLGRMAAIVAAFGLAIDPLLSGASRMAGGPMLAVGLAMLALAAFIAGRRAVFGVLVGILLLTGPYVITGLLAAGLTWAFFALLKRSGKRTGLEDTEIEISPAHFRESLPWLAGAFLLVGTLFMRVPQGLGGAANSLPAYLSGWAAPSGVSASQVLVAFGLYQVFPLVFALFGVLRAWTNSGTQAAFGRVLSIWVLSVLLLTLIYPGRQAADLAWAAPGLWGLAAVEISLFLQPAPRIYRWISLALALFLLILVAFTWVNFASIASFSGTTVHPEWRRVLVLVVGGFALALMGTLMAALGWTWPTARWGLAWGFGLALFIFSLSNLWVGTGIKSLRSLEILYPASQPAETDLLLRTMQDLSLWTTGHPNELEVDVQVDSSSLQWLLRDWQQARFSQAIAVGDLPQLLITADDQPEPALAAGYRGQRFALDVKPRWSGTLPENWPRWITFRQGPVLERSIILWARTDLFPGGDTSANLDIGLERP